MIKAESDLVKAESELMMIRESMNHHLTLTPWATRRAVRERTLV